MARVTVEDCIDKVENRFELVLLASHRARMISNGSPLTIDRDNDKNPVVALREVAEQTVSPEDLKEDLIHSLQKYVEVDEPEAEAVPMVPNTSSPAGRHRGQCGRRQLGRVRPHVGRGPAARARGPCFRRSARTISDRRRRRPTVAAASSSGHAAPRQLAGTWSGRHPRQGGGRTM